MQKKKTSGLTFWNKAFCITVGHSELVNSDTFSYTKVQK